VQQNGFGLRGSAEVEGDKATLYFECLWMDVDNNSVGTHSFSDMKLARVHGHWLVVTRPGTSFLHPG
jgi:hypothetical protein